jgi:hypothetical protein
VFEKDQLLRRTLYLKDPKGEDKSSFITEVDKDKEIVSYPLHESELKQ